MTKDYSFAEFDAMVGTRKTGYYGNHVDMYTKRDGSNERVFRVKWMDRSSKFPTHADYVKYYKRAIKGIGIRRNQKCVSQEWVEQNQTFPYTPEGLEAALKFAKNIEPKWEAFWNRETL